MVPSSRDISFIVSVGTVVQAIRAAIVAINNDVLSIGCAPYRFA